jgi:hypothetical protein
MVNVELTAPTTETGKKFWALIEQYWRQGATVAQAIQAAKETVVSRNNRG